MIRNEKYPVQMIRLDDKKGGSFTVRLRVGREGDEEGMIACIRDEYGQTYFKQSFYEPEFIRREAVNGSITSLVAETEEDGIIGMLILKQFYPEEDMCEIASQIFRKKYRGYGLAMPFLRYGMDILLSRGYSAAFCLPVLFHDMTQRLLYRLGLRAVGIILNVFDMDRIPHSYQNGRNRKHSQGIQVRALGKRDAGILYIPAEHQAFCGKIYDSLGVSYRMEEPPAEGVCPEETILTYKNDALQQSLEIRIHKAGKDLEQKIRAIHVRYPLCGKQTAGIFLNCNDPQAVWAYRFLIKQGYFFTGLKPLCSEKEYMVLHHPGQVETVFEDYRVSNEFGSLIKYIEACCQKRITDQGREEKE